MSHQDRKSAGRIEFNHEALRNVLKWLLPSTLFAGMRVRKGATWTPRLLAFTALLWSASDGPNLEERFQHARKIIRKMFSWLPAPGKSREGFLKVLHRWHATLVETVIGALRSRMRQEFNELMWIAGFLVFAADGSRVQTPRTKSNQDAFSPQRNKKKRKHRKKSKSKKARRRAAAAKRRKYKRQSAESIKKKTDLTHMWLTLLWNVGTGLPWSWRSGPSDGSERHHLLEMLSEMPEDSLITADAGFVGYEFWNAILEAGHNFVIRVGGNVKLIKRLGYARQYDHTVYLWPDRAAKKQMPPLVLRLIELHDGKHPVFLVTNLNKQRLSDRQAVEIYRSRWGIELFFRTFKQTFGCSKLRSRAAENAELELDWSLLGLWSICLSAQRELVRAGADPSRLSAAAAIKAIRSTMRDYRLRPDSPDETLTAMFSEALLDEYQRSSSKASRGYPRKKKRERTTAPKIVKATKSQIAIAKEVKAIHQQIRLAA